MTTTTNNLLIKTAQDAFEKWDTLGIYDRATCLEQALAPLPEEQRKMAQWQLQNAKQQLAEPHVMPGPTGEHNELSTQGRGVFLCTIGFEEGLENESNSEKVAIGFVGQIFTALIAGNTVIVAGQSKESMANKLIKNLVNSIAPFVTHGVIQYTKEPEAIINSDTTKKNAAKT